MRIDVVKRYLSKYKNLAVDFGFLPTKWSEPDVSDKRDDF